MGVFGVELLVQGRTSQFLFHKDIDDDNLDISSQFLDYEHDEELTLSHGAI